MPWQRIDSRLGSASSPTFELRPGAAPRSPLSYYANLATRGRNVIGVGVLGGAKESIPSRRCL